MIPTWQSGDVTLYLGDCLEVLPTRPDNSVDLIATDPPYYKVKDEPWDRQWDTPAGFLAWLDRVLAEFYRLLKPNGSLYLFASPRMAARVEVLIAERFEVLNSIVWAKPTPGRGGGAEKEGLRGYFPNTERIIFAEHYGADGIAKGESGWGAKCDELRGFVFEPLRAYLDGERIAAGWRTEDVGVAWMAWQGKESKWVTRLAGHWFERVQWALPTADNYAWLRDLFNRNGGEYLRREYEDLRRPFIVSADVPYTDVWTFPTVPANNGKHPCEKPLAMMEHIIRASSRPGAVVLDPFMGRATTGLAALNLGRQFVGIDATPEWYEKGKTRIEQAQMQTRMAI